MVLRCFPVYVLLFACLTRDRLKCFYFSRRVHKTTSDADWFTCWGVSPLVGGGACSKVAVSAGKDARSDPEFLLEKLGGFDFASAAGEGAGGGKGLEALSQLKQTLAKVLIEHHPCRAVCGRRCVWWHCCVPYRCRVLVGLVTAAVLLLSWRLLAGCSVVVNGWLVMK